MRKQLKPEFSLKPMHTEDPFDFSSKQNVEDDSPLPTSALPYCYPSPTKEGSPCRSRVSTSIFPPMDSEPEEQYLSGTRTGPHTLKTRSFQLNIGLHSNQIVFLTLVKSINMSEVLITSLVKLANRLRIAPVLTS